MPLGKQFVRDMTFVELLFVIVLGWILVELWHKTIDNFTFTTLSLNEKSTYHTFIIALVATSVFLVFVFSFDSIMGNIVESDIAGGFSPPAPPGPLIGATMNFTITESGEILSNSNCHDCIQLF